MATRSLAAIARENCDYRLQIVSLTSGTTQTLALFAGTMGAFVLRAIPLLASKTCSAHALTGQFRQHADVCCVRVSMPDLHEIAAQFGWNTFTQKRAPVRCGARGVCSHKL